MHSQMPRIDIEVEMQKVVRSVGGWVLSEHIPHSPNFANADFVFHEQRIVAELKCLTDDNVFSATNSEKVENIWRRCYVKKLVTKPYINRVDWEQLPRTVQNEIYKVQTRTIKKRVQAANKQVRETKQRLGLQDYSGVLFIANDGVTSISPPAFIHATQLALENDFREIRHFVFFTANLYARMRHVRQPALFWIVFDMQDGQPINSGFLNGLGAAWRSHCVQIMGVAGAEGEMHDMEGFWKSSYLE